VFPQHVKSLVRDSDVACVQVYHHSQARIDDLLFRLDGAWGYNLRLGRYDLPIVIAPYGPVSGLHGCNDSERVSVADGSFQVRYELSGRLCYAS
jgi:hypothetical protein